MKGCSLLVDALIFECFYHDWSVLCYYKWVLFVRNVYVSFEDDVIPSGGECNALKQTKVNERHVMVSSVDLNLFWVNLVLLVSLWSFFKFWVQSRKNIHDIRKVCLRMYLCVLMCLDEFFIFVFVETKVRCS